MLTERLKAIAEAAGLACGWIARKTGQRKPPVLVVVPDALPGGAPTALGTVSGQEAIALLRDAADALEEMERAGAIAEHLASSHKVH